MLLPPGFRLTRCPRPLQTGASGTSKLMGSNGSQVVLPKKVLSYLR
jgi:hypothetical protein